eukprot:TRINITY_DN4161_c0_g1_i2.p1 TRINITY_DN4161_c0_g1~~TRINITY_DN4161_c0_g1_i2.p1  ORF type:complete len:753 (+),score=124.79 TRINITY_DN4161_c0_g1_i2:328-2259(+)
MAGDFLSPYLLSSIDKGKNMVKLMNQVGFTHACLGNHEFDMSVKVLVDRLAEMQFKVVNSNIHHLKKTIPHDVVEVNLGTQNAPDIFRIGFLGFCTEKTKRLCNNVPYDVTISKIDTVAPPEITRLRQELACDFVVLLTHQDAKYDEKMAAELDVNLVIGGHDHVKIIERIENKNFQRDNWVIKCGMDATLVGVTTVLIGDHGSSAPISPTTSPLSHHWEFVPESGRSVLSRPIPSPQPGPSHRSHGPSPLTLHLQKPALLEPTDEFDVDVLLDSNQSPLQHHSPHGRLKADEGDETDLTVTSYECGRHSVKLFVQTVDIASPLLPSDPVVDVMIDHANSIVKHVESQYLVKEPLSNKGARVRETPFAKYVLSRVRDWNHVDCVLVPAGIFKGKLDYPNGFRISDLHNEFKWDEFLLLKMPPDVIGDAISFSRSQGDDFRGYLQMDDGLVLTQVENSLKWKVEKINGAVPEPTKKYFVLIARSTKVETSTKLFNPVIAAYIKRVRSGATPLRRRHSVTYGDSSNSSSTSSNNAQLSMVQQEQIRRDIHHHHHERPTVVETVIAAMITQNWKTLFGPIMSEDDSIYLSKKEALEQLKDESLVNAVFHAAGANNGRIQKDQLRRALRQAQSLPERPKNEFLDSDM